jgi:hypothetical protein
MLLCDGEHRLLLYDASKYQVRLQAELGCERMATSSLTAGGLDTEVKEWSTQATLTKRAELYL